LGQLSFEGTRILEVLNKAENKNVVKIGLGFFYETDTESGFRINKKEIFIKMKRHRNMTKKIPKDMEIVRSVRKLLN
jgi:hypothetical protein